LPLFDMRRQPDHGDGVHLRVVPTVDVGAHNALMAELVIGVLRLKASSQVSQWPISLCCQGWKPGLACGSVTWSR
tara:strand:+ start:1216 stop:1440 length:225 start_codon:yes stop_codon:yes gene_type:complete